MGRSFVLINETLVSVQNPKTKNISAAAAVRESSLSFYDSAAHMWKPKYLKIVAAVGCRGSHLGLCFLFLSTRCCVQHSAIIN